MSTTDQTPTEPVRWRIQTTCDKDEIARLLADGWEPFSVYRDMVALRTRETITNPNVPDPPTPARQAKAERPAQQVRRQP